MADECVTKTSAIPRNGRRFCHHIYLILPHRLHAASSSSWKRYPVAVSMTYPEICIASPADRDFYSFGVGLVSDVCCMEYFIKICNLHWLSVINLELRQGGSEQTDYYRETTWRIRLNDACSTAMQALATVL